MTGQRSVPAEHGAAGEGLMPVFADDPDHLYDPALLRDPAHPDDGDDDDDRPLPDLPPLPADPRWRIEHLPFVVAVGTAVVLFAASAGFLVDGVPAAMGAAAGVLLVTVGVTLTTLTIAWADTIRPELVMPAGLGVFITKYALVVLLLFSISTTGWPGFLPMVWGVAAGSVVITGVQAWWLTRLARRRLSETVHE